MIELLILSMCIGEMQCPTLTKAYLEYNDSVKKNIKFQGKRLERQMGKEIFVATGIAYSGLARNKIKARLMYKIVLEYDYSSDERLQLSWRKDF